MSCVLYTARNITGAFSSGLICNMRLIETKHKDITLLTNRKTEQGKSFIEKTSGLHINNYVNYYDDFYMNTARHMKSWIDVYHSLDVSMFEKYDEIYIMGGLHFPQSDISRFSKRASTFPNDRGQMKFIQTGSHIVNALALHKAHVLLDKPLHEFVYDTDELSVNTFNLRQNPSKYNSYHIYDYPKYNLQRLDSLQYFFSKQSKSVIEEDKVFDFTFGYTVYKNGNRPSYVTFVNDISKRFDKVNMFVKNVITGENNVVDRDTYLNLISKSKFTLILPSYDNECFSLYRFIESIYNDCLPLIHPECNISDVEKSFDVDLKSLYSNNVIDENRRIELLNYMKDKFLIVDRGFN